VLIDCDTCTVRGPGCDDCVVTVLLGAPPGWREEEPTVVPLTRRTRQAGVPGGQTAGIAERAGGGTVAGTGGGWNARERSGGVGDMSRVDNGAEAARPVVELDDVERRAVRALADFGLVPPLRHQEASKGTPVSDLRANRHAG
jgi:hypothetical protein